MDAGGFFRRRRPELPAAVPGYTPFRAPNLNEFLFLPVSAGLWRQHEMWDGTYTLDDLLDAAELILVRRENERRAVEAQQQF